MSVWSCSTVSQAACLLNKKHLKINMQNACYLCIRIYERGRWQFCSTSGLPLTSWLSAPYSESLWGTKDLKALLCDPTPLTVGELMELNSRHSCVRTQSCYEIARRLGQDLNPPSQALYPWHRFTCLLSGLLGSSAASSNCCSAIEQILWSLWVMKVSE